jgi:hypothetical protein
MPTVRVQQDNTKPHIKADDQRFVDAVAATGMDIKLINQLPNSPDMNVLDLGFFRAIQFAPATLVQNNR